MDSLLRNRKVSNSNEKKKLLAVFVIYWSD